MALDLSYPSLQVVYCKGTKLQVKVHAEAVNPKDDTRETTNDFHFTFNTRTHEVNKVMPKTYAGKWFLTVCVQIANFGLTGPSVEKR